MDAQQITFNQDPETSATEIDQEDDKNACCCLLCIPCKLFYWYIAPMTCELCHTLKCFLFHPINFGAAIFFVVFDATMLGVGIGLIPLCCMGFPLLWITMECIIALSRLDLGLHYYFVEDGKNLDESKRHLLKLSLYSTDIPLCCCYNQGQNCANLMFDRMKFLATNLEIYKYIFYQLFIRSIVGYCTWGIMIVVAVNVALIGLPGWYLVDDSMFKENKIVLGWHPDCTSPDGGGIYCPKDYVWIINTLERAMGVAIISLLVLPLTMRVSNYFAYLNKILSYRFYTFYYSKDADRIQGSKPILTNHVNVKFEAV